MKSYLPGKLTAFLIILFSFSLFGQAPENLEMLLRLADSSVSRVIARMPENQAGNLFVKADLAGDYTVFRSRILSAIQHSGRNIVLAENESSDGALFFTVEGAKISYPDSFRDGLLGDVKVTREARLNVSFVLTSRGNESKAETFSLKSTDTINFDQIGSLENAAIPFTRGDIPAEPFFSTIWEPVVAIGTAALAVYLFFTVRGK